VSDILRDASETKPLVDGQSAARGASESAHMRATAVATPAGAMSPDRVERRGAEGAEASERLEEGSPSRRGRNDEPSSTNVVAEHARDENDHHDETAHLKQLHALLRRSDAWRTHALVRLATSRGFVDAETRQSAWPRVLGICEIDKRAFRDAAARKHLDSSVVDADVERSLWAFTSAWRESDREATRAKLRRVIDGVVNVHGDEELDEDEEDDANGGLKKKKTDTTTKKSSHSLLPGFPRRVFGVAFELRREDRVRRGGAFGGVPPAGLHETCVGTFARFAVSSRPVTRVGG
jgi:hypothetical protein